MEVVTLNPSDTAHFNQMMNLLYDEWHDMFRESGLRSVTAITRYYRANIKTIRFFVLIEDDRVVAGYSFMIRNNRLFLCDFIVHPSLRKRGYSTKLMSDACSRAFKEGWQEMYLNATKSLVPFYTKYGFTPIGYEGPNNKWTTMMRPLGRQATDGQQTLTNYFVLLVFGTTVAALTWIALS